MEVVGVSLNCFNRALPFWGNQQFSRALKKFSGSCWLICVLTFYKLSAGCDLLLPNTNTVLSRFTYWTRLQSDVTINYTKTLTIFKFYGLCQIELGSTPPCEKVNGKLWRNQLIFSYLDFYGFSFGPSVPRIFVRPHVLLSVSGGRMGFIWNAAAIQIKSIDLYSIWTYL